MAKPRVAAIIQARMGSTRLPGKVLMPLAGKPVLWHVVHRLRKSQMVDVIAIATSTNPADDLLVPFAAELGVLLVRGPEENVLERFVLAARELGADYFIRVTGDAPFVDSETIDILVRGMISRDADYCSANSPVPTIHEGFDPFSNRALMRLRAEAGDDPVAREHVTAYFKQHPNFCRVASVELPAGFEIDGVRTSVDTPADLFFLETLYQRLDASPGEINLRDVVALLHREPELKRINAHVRQKDADRQYGLMLIRCDGSSKLGLGHIIRCLALGMELRDTHGIGLCFALGEDGVGAEMVRRHYFPVDIRPAGIDEEGWIESLIQRFDPEALILDIRTDLGRTALHRWRQSGVGLAVIDDPSDRRLEGDMVFYPPTPQVEEMDWSGFTGQRYTGWEWVLLRRQFARQGWDTRKSSYPLSPTLLVSMGGSDPANLTFKALEALDRLDGEFQSVVVLGPGFLHKVDLARWIASARRQYLLHFNVREMADLMAGADLAVGSFGVTAYELAAMGVPAIHLCLTEDHAKAAVAMTKAGIAVSLGLHSQVTNGDISNAVSELLNDPDKRNRMGTHAIRLIDGNGAKRIAEKIDQKFRR